jgi:ABC-2 type transport system permease protein
VKERWQRIGSTVGLEVLIQRREPLTILYALVLFLLACAFAAVGPVELVRNRGLVPRDAPWSIMLACTALTAFGQVITTMVAATVVLRDRSDRVDELFSVSRLTTVEYRSAKLVAALLLLCVVYCAVPVGLVLGAVLAGGSWFASIESVLPAFLVVVLPTMLSVGALQFSVGVLSGRLWTIVAFGLALIWLWSSAVDLTSRAGAPWMVALLDPFGSAPIVAATRAWSEQQRSVNTIPFTSALLWNRLLWLSVAGTLAAFAICRSRTSASRAVSVPNATPGERFALREVQASGNTAISACRAVYGTALYVMRWMLRDAGWRVLTVMGMINVGVHAFADAGTATTAATTTTVAINALHTHARLFLILLGTIYAGELVWRERDERSAPLFDALPVRDIPALTGRVCGVVGAAAVVVVLLGLSAGVGVALGAHHAALTGQLGADAAFLVWLTLALAVHSLIQHKVAAHLLLIAGWVAVVVARPGTAAGASDHFTGSALSAVALVSLIGTWLGWQRAGQRAHPFHWGRR